LFDVSHTSGVRSLCELTAWGEDKEGVSMTTLRFLGAAAATSALAACVSAQTPYSQPYPQASPGYGYPYQGHGPNVIQQIIDQLLGNRYSVSDRNLVSRCASAALAQAQRQYPYGAYGRGYPQPYAGGQRNYPVAMMRVAAITEVQRRSSGLRVRGLIDSGYGSPYAYPSGNQPYVDPRYARIGDLTFRCDVDYRGTISNVRIGRNTAYRR
jgi:hypothetical protein